jgi:hypothetical protein
MLQEVNLIHDLGSASCVPVPRGKIRQRSEPVAGAILARARADQRQALQAG